MVWSPIASDEVVNVAIPPLSAATLSVAVPSRKVTVPVGVPVPSWQQRTRSQRLSRISRRKC